MVEVQPATRTISASGQAQPADQPAHGERRCRSSPVLSGSSGAMPHAHFSAPGGADERLEAAGSARRSASRRAGVQWMSNPPSAGSRPILARDRTSPARSAARGPASAAYCRRYRRAAANRSSPWRSSRNQSDHAEPGRAAVQPQPVAIQFSDRRNPPLASGVKIASSLRVRASRRPAVKGKARCDGDYQAI